MTRQGRAGAALLVIGLVAATTWAVMVADWVDGTGVTLVAAVVAAAEAALLARSLVGRAVAGLAAPLLGLIVIVLLTAGSMPADGGAGLRHAAFRYAGALTDGLFRDDPWTFLVGLCGVMWLVGFWTGWVAIREHRGVLAVLPAYAVLAVNDLNAPNLDHVLVPETCAIALSLLVVIRCHLAHLESGWRRRRIIALPGTARSYVGAGAAGSGIVLILALVVPPLTTVDISGRIFHVGSGPGGGSGQGGLRGGGTDQQAPIEFSDDTKPGGALVANPQPVLSYTSDNSQSVYLRVVNDTVFSQGNWYYCRPPAATRPLGAGGAVPFDAIPADGALGTLERRVRVRISLDPDAVQPQPEALFAGEPQAVLSGASAAAGTAASCAHPAGEAGGGLLSVDRVVLAAQTQSLQTTGLMPTATEDQLRSSGVDDPAWTQQFTLLPTALPADTSQRVAIAGLARQWTGGLTNRYDIATAIETRLRSPEFTYTLTPPRAPSSIWPITYFLFTSRLGYCQYFASSMATMLRSLGIPARVVGGYGGGTEDDTIGPARTIVHRVSSTDAHNWVEAYFPHYGWIPFEPTPPSAVAGNYETFPRGPQPDDSKPSGPLNTPSTPLPEPKTKPAPNPTTANASTAQGGPPAGLVALVAVLLLIGVLLFAGWRWLTSARTGGAVRQRMRVWGIAFGVHRRPSDTDAGYACRLAEALPADTTTLLHRDGSAPPGPRPVRATATEALTLIAEISGKERYSVEGLLPTEEVRRRRAWQRVCRLSLLLLWRRMLAVTVRV